MTGRIGRLHLVTDAQIEPAAIVPKLGAAASAGVNVVQLRYPHLAARDLVEVVKAARGATSGCGTSVIVNDRVDVAVAAEADGVHLGQRSLNVRDARLLAGPGLIVGVSVHSVAEAKDAADTGADYLTFGHVFATASHPGKPGRGLEALAALVRAVAPLPVMAIGGITADRVPVVLAAGAHGVAVMRGILSSDDPLRATTRFVRAVDLCRNVEEVIHEH